MILALIGDYTNWPPVQGREKNFLEQSVRICKDYGAELRFLDFASHRFEVNLDTKRAVACALVDVKPDVAFMLWSEDHHQDHVVAAALSKVALRHGDRVLDAGSYKAPKRSTLTTTARVTRSASNRIRTWTSPRFGPTRSIGWGN